jgi:hypothetical protein
MAFMLSVGSGLRFIHGFMLSVGSGLRFIPGFYAVSRQRVEIHPWLYAANQLRVLEIGFEPRQKPAVITRAEPGFRSRPDSVCPSRHCSSEVVFSSFVLPRYNL